eukprot:scaffold33859_cov60-Attheya_sp.AAC.2
MGLHGSKKYFRGGYATISNDSGRLGKELDIGGFPHASIQQDQGPPSRPIRSRLLRQGPRPHIIPLFLKRFHV